MASGNPIVAVLGVDDTLRAFELSGDTVVQIGSTALTNSFFADFPSQIFFPYDGAFVLVTNVYASANNRTRMRTFDPLNLSAGQIDWLDRPDISLASLNAGTGAYIYGDERFAFFTTNNSSTAEINNCSHVTATGELGVSDTTIMGRDIDRTNLRSVTFSPDTHFGVIGSAYGLPSEIGYTDPVTPTRYVTSELAADFGIDGMAWSKDSSYLVTYAAEGQIQIFKRNGNTLDLVSWFTDALGTPISIAASPDGKTFAIGFDDAGAVRAGIFRRVDNYLSKKQTLTGIGAFLNFTADGAHLIDASSRKLFRRGTTGAFAEVVGSMDNIPAGATAQGVSPHVANPQGIGSLYDISVGDLVYDAANLQALKITLLTDAAAFDTTHTALSQVTGAGAYEVGDGGWPAGGISLDNVQSQINGPIVNVTCDPVTRIMVGSGASFRYAVIYDSSDDRPLVFVDFLTTQAFPEAVEVKIDFQSSGIIAYSQ